jgi:hypothetical protein
MKSLFRPIEVPAIAWWLMVSGAIVGQVAYDAQTNFSPLAILTSTIWVYAGLIFAGRKLIELRHP